MIDFLELVYEKFRVHGLDGLPPTTRLVFRSLAARSLYSTGSLSGGRVKSKHGTWRSPEEA